MSDDPKDDRTRVSMAEVLPRLELNDLRLMDDDLVAGCVAVFKVIPMRGRPYLQVRTSESLSWFEAIGMLQSTATLELRNLGGG